MILHTNVIILHVFQMKLGFGMNLIGIGVNLLWLHSYGTYFFQLDTFPQWAVKGLSDAFQ